MRITKVRVEVDPTTFVPMVKFEGQFKMEPNIEYPYGTGDLDEIKLGSYIMQQIVEKLKQQEAENNAH